MGAGKDGFIKGVMDDFKITENRSASVRNKNRLSRISFYPNPGNTSIYHFKSESPLNILEITNSIGQAINYELSGNAVKINADAGIYYLKGMLEGSIFTQKLLLYN